MYAEGEYDLAGFAVGVVEKSGIVDGRDIAAGDVVLGLASSGAHSNGYSLVRRILDRANPDLRADFHGRPLGDVLLEPTRIYVKPVLALMEEVRVKGLAHITGGGLAENLPRAIPETLKAAISRSAWKMPPLFEWLRREGEVAEAEMLRVFNCGIGMAIVVAAGSADAARRALTASGETVFRIGRIEARSSGEPQCVVS
jgi:phosphoribosylformylglycinamidine cyclo-ligase